MSIHKCHEPDGVLSLRMAHGISQETLARHCSLSVKQLRQIEEGGSDAFYSPAIKQQAIQKVMDALKNTGSLKALQTAMRRDALLSVGRGSPFTVSSGSAHAARLF